MSADRDVTRIVRSWLEDGATALPDRVLDSVLDQLPATSQRRSRWPARRAQPMTSLFKLALSAAAVVVVMVAGLSFLPLGRSGSGGVGVASPSPEPSQNLPPDRMSVAGSTVRANVDLPDDWDNNEFVANTGTTDTGGMRMILSVIDNTFEDPCSHAQRAPKVGSTVQSVATALTEIPSTTATDPVAVTVAGHEGTYLELTIPAALPCQADQFYLWQDSPGATWWLLAPSEVIQFWILDVEGTPVAIAASSWPATNQATRAEFQGILDSIVFDGSS